MQSTIANRAVDGAFQQLGRVVDDARLQVDALPQRSRAAVLIANRIVATVGAGFGALVAEHMCQQSALAPRLLAVRDRFESHVLAASVLEASDASPDAVLKVQQTGLAHLAGELAALGTASPVTA